MGKTRIPRKYTDRGVDKKFERTKKYYDKGDIIEAFALLYAVIETQLRAIFKFYLFDKLSIKMYDELDYHHKWEYSQLIRVLSEIRVLSYSDYQKFAQFQDGRHKAIHELPMPGLHEKLNMKTLNSSFNSGKKAYQIAKTKLEKLYRQEVNKINLDDPNERKKFIGRLEEVLKSGRKKQLV